MKSQSTSVLATAQAPPRVVGTIITTDCIGVQEVRSTPCSVGRKISKKRMGGSEHACLTSEEFISGSSPRAGLPESPSVTPQPRERIGDMLEWRGSDPSSREMLHWVKDLQRQHFVNQHSIFLDTPLQENPTISYRPLSVVPQRPRSAPRPGLMTLHGGSRTTAERIAWANVSGRVHAIIPVRFRLRVSTPLSVLHRPQSAALKLSTRKLSATWS